VNRRQGRTTQASETRTTQASEIRTTQASKIRTTSAGPNGGCESVSPDEHDSQHRVKVLGVKRLLPVPGTSMQRIAAIAERQRGRVTRRQLLAAGISKSAIGRMISRGLLHPEHVGVYTVAHRTPVPFGRETGALLACGDRACLSHGSAGAVWGILEPDRGAVEVTIVACDSGRRRPEIEVHHSRDLAARDLRVHNGLPLTSPARTLLDLAGRLDRRSLERALDEALVVRKIVSRSQILDILGRANGHAGASMLRALMARRRNSAITHSEAERRCLELIRKAGLPEPQTQVTIAGYKVDLLWPDHRVVFEIDGYGFHTSRLAFDRDRRKDAALKAAAYDPNRLSRDQVMFEPYLAIAAISAALTRAAYT
jgi:very-short-patch-repair endonuclease